MPQLVLHVGSSGLYNGRLQVITLCDEYWFFLQLSGWSLYDDLTIWRVAPSWIVDRIWGRCRLETCCHLYTQQSTWGLLLLMPILLLRHCFNLLMVSILQDKTPFHRASKANRFKSHWRPLGIVSRDLHHETVCMQYTRVHIRSKLTPIQRYFDRISKEAKVNIYHQCY